MRLADDVLAFLREVPAAPFGPLAPETALRATEELWARSTLAESMGLVVLNDTEDSNQYCVVTRGPAAGAVVFVPHDDGPSFELHDIDRHAEVSEVTDTLRPNASS